MQLVFDKDKNLYLLEIPDAAVNSLRKVFNLTELNSYKRSYFKKIRIWQLRSSESKVFSLSPKYDLIIF
jgi:hypothetical protein